MGHPLLTVLHTTRCRLTWPRCCQPCRHPPAPCQGLTGPRALAAFLYWKSGQASEEAAQGGGGVTTPGGVQKMCRDGTWGQGVVGTAVLDWQLGLMILAVFSSLNNSVTCPRRSQLPTLPFAPVLEYRPPITPSAFRELRSMPRDGGDGKREQGGNTASWEGGTRPMARGGGASAARCSPPAPAFAGAAGRGSLPALGRRPTGAGRCPALPRGVGQQLLRRRGRLGLAAVPGPAAALTRPCPARGAERSGRRAGRAKRARSL